jgi:hypothetical protein
MDNEGKRPPAAPDVGAEKSKGRLVAWIRMGPGARGGQFLQLYGVADAMIQCEGEWLSPVYEQDLQRIGSNEDIGATFEAWFKRTFPTSSKLESGAFFLATHATLFRAFRAGRLGEPFTISAEISTDLVHDAD